MRLPERFCHCSLSLDNAAEFDVPSILRSLFCATRTLGRSFGGRGRRDGASGAVVYDDGLTGVVDAFEDGGDVAGVGGGEVALCCCLNHCGTSILSCSVGLGPWCRPAGLDNWPLGPSVEVSTGLCSDETVKQPPAETESRSPSPSIMQYTFFV
jgi:hypothetical protein